ncbi:ATP-binding cassette domain-containing protein [Streptomyces sp. NPDC058657]|uniref:ATP-binding cassette domain-containing protein n=1 Tax=unclassified Streptomyces TaxID=2593676 RepID=UPI003669BD8C
MDSPHTGTATTEGATLTAVDFGLKGPRGWAFRGVELTAPAGSFVAIEGPSGSGRTCLLLALTGRMRATEGHAEVGGLRLPKKLAAVRRISALGPVAGVNDLDPAYTVAEHLRERALLQRRFDGSLRSLLQRPSVRRAAARARIDAAMAAVGLDLASLPKGERTSVRDLERLEGLRLSLGLALMCGPRLLAVDDADLKLSDAEREQAWELLRSVADSGTTVLAVCSEPPEDALRVRVGDVREEPAQEVEHDVRPAQDVEHDVKPAQDTKHEAKPAQDTKHDLKKDTTEEGAADALAETGRS